MLNSIISVQLLSVFVVIVKQTGQSLYLLDFIPYMKLNCGNSFSIQLT
jgi:hypothetical protein